MGMYVAWFNSRFIKELEKREVGEMGKRGGGKRQGREGRGMEREEYICGYGLSRLEGDLNITPWQWEGIGEI